MLRRTNLIALLSAILANGATAGSNSYDLLEIDNRIAKWGEPMLGSGATVTYAFAREHHAFPRARNCQSIAPLANLLSTTGFDEGAFRLQTKRAFAAWSEVANIRFEPAADGVKPDILIGAQGLPRGQAFANVSLLDDTLLELAGNQTSRPLSSMTKRPRVNSAPGDKTTVGRIDQALICLNPLHRWKIGRDGNKRSYDLHYTLTHEIGHAIGLDHAGARGLLMSFSYQEDLVGLQSGDILGVQRLYGAAKPH